MKWRARCLAMISGLLLLARPGYADPPIEEMYGTYCVQCHGLNRNGTGINLPALSVQPRDHTDSKAMGDTPDDELFKAIKEGGLSVNKSILMPTWGGVLTDAQITEMVKYLHQVCHCGNKSQ
jgi:cytochrome c oxidase cbb3-type subunit 3